ncbi:MAG: hypothetical protein K2K64_09510 [Muribaculaceae bacterium]|nr:hypothetical protein [Muribaculaceae bacterium]
MNLTDRSGLFPTEKEAMEYSTKNLMGATAFLDNENKEWYLALNETGKIAYTGRGKMVEFYGVDSPFNTPIPGRSARLSTVGTAFNQANSLKLNMIESVAKGDLKGKGIPFRRTDEAVKMALGKSMLFYFRVFKITALVLDGWYLFDQGREFYGRLSKGDLNVWMGTRIITNAVFTVVGYGGWGGYGLSLGYFLIDAAVGDEIWDWMSDGEINK